MHDEKIVHRGLLHPFIFAQPAVILLLGWLYGGMETGIFRYLGWLLLLLGAVSLLQRLLLVVGADYGITDRRLIFKSGVVSRRIHMLEHAQIEVVSITQPFWGRLMGYGTIEVTTGGAVKLYPYVARPVRFKMALNDTLETSRIRHIINQIKPK